MDDLYDYNVLNFQWDDYFDENDWISNNNWVSSVYDHKIVNKNMKEFYKNQLNKEKYILDNDIKEFNNIKQLIVDPVLVSMLDNDNHITIIKLSDGKFDQILESNKN